MKISVPLTGTLISYNPPIGDPNDPVRIIDIDLGNVSWQLISLDFEHDLALIEVTPADEEVSLAEGKVMRRKLTNKEKQALLDNAKRMIQDKTIGELYRESKSARLKKPK